MNLKKADDKKIDAGIISEDTKNQFELKFSILTDEDYNPTGETKTVTCPECGNKIEMAEGCFICLNCGYSGCL